MRCLKGGAGSSLKFLFLSEFEYGMLKIMTVNEHLRNAIFEVINNQINADDPPETALTLERLKNEGYSEFQAKQLIGQAVIIEVIDALKNKKPYNEERYLRNLRNLPKEPQE
jgi:hypothetical protein